MIDIQVGEYVRTTQGYIAKVERIDDTFIWFDGVIWFDYEASWELRIKSELGLDDQSNEIIKHSFNIIDLIDIGDYVNGILVFNITIATTEKGNEWVYIGRDEQNILPAIALRKETIKTIVTKEQFKSMEYKVGDDEV